MTVMKLKPLHSGEVLREEFLRPLEAVGGAIGQGAPCAAPPHRAAGCRADRSVSGFGVAVGEYFENTPEFWLTLKGRYERERAEDELGLDARAD